jgi:hypothetical protein
MEKTKLNSFRLSKYSLFVLMLVLVTILSCNKNQNVSSEASEEKIEIRSMRIENFEVLLNSIEQMTWEESNEFAKKLGNGWRLPTKEEFVILNTNQPTLETSGKISLWKGGYWTSTELNESLAWQCSFEFGYYQEYYSKNTLAYAIFIKSIN